MQILTGVLLTVPVAFHRMLFRERRRELLVESANRFAIAGLATLAATLSGVVLWCVDVVVGRGPAWVAGGSVMLLVASTPRNPPPSAGREPDA